MSGNALTFLGVMITVAGMIVAGWGVFLTNAESDRKTAEIVKLNEELRAQATGGHSFFHFHIDGFGTDDAKAQLKVCGDFALRHATIEVFDVTQQGRGFKGSYDPNEYQKVLHSSMVAIHPNSPRRLSTYPFEKKPEGDFYKYLAIVDATNGTTQQEIIFNRTPNGWRQAYVVVALDSSLDTDRVLLTYADDPKDSSALIECGSVR